LTVTALTGFTTANLDNQGFGDLPDEAKFRLRWPLRFTPAVSTALVATGLALRSPIWVGSMALVALTGVLVPSGMLVDVAYNLGFRHLFGSPPLPPTPKPRRFSYGLSCLLLAASALSLERGLPVLGLVLGGMVVIGGTILSATLWCVGSFVYGQLLGQP
jgi:Domain of unknown function (DUF4395)